jgi:hypothetical protein
MPAVFLNLRLSYRRTGLRTSGSQVESWSNRRVRRRRAEMVGVQHGQDAHHAQHIKMPSKMVCWACTECTLLIKLMGSILGTSQDHPGILMGFAQKHPTIWPSTMVCGFLFLSR